MACLTGKNGSKKNDMIKYGQSFGISLTDKIDFRTRKKLNLCSPKSIFFKQIANFSLAT